MARPCNYSSSMFGLVTQVSLGLVLYDQHQIPLLRAFGSSEIYSFGHQCLNGRYRYFHCLVLVITCHFHSAELIFCNPLQLHMMLDFRKSVHQQTLAYIDQIRLVLQLSQPHCSLVGYIRKSVLELITRGKVLQRYKAQRTVLCKYIFGLTSKDKVKGDISFGHLTLRAEWYLLILWG